VHTFHGHVFHSYYSPVKTKMFLAIERTLARAATDRIIVLSEQQREEISQTFRVGRHDQFAVIPLGIDVEKFTPDVASRRRLRDELGFGDDDIVVGYVGRLTEIKNLPLLLETAALFKDGHLRPELESLAASLGLARKVSFLGSRSEIAELYSAFDIVALTSRNEGTPLSLIEAMAAGKPVISTGVGGVRDLLAKAETQDGAVAVCERGIRIDSSLPADFQKGLQYLIQDKELRSRLAERGKEFARANYGKERLIADIKSLYRSL
jgi:glycosyltransferase involved in cell wall biosynthesis